MAKKADWRKCVLESLTKSLKWIVKKLGLSLNFNKREWSSNELSKQCKVSQFLWSLYALHLAITSYVSKLLLSEFVSFRLNAIIIYF